jgi:undecaprenyl-diphosphatase
MSRNLPAGCSSLILAIFSVLGFGVVAQSVLNQGAITRFDVQHADRCFHAAVQDPQILGAAQFITNFAGRPFLVPIVLGVTALLVLDRKPAVALIWILVHWGQHELVKAAKIEFCRARPCWNDEMCRLGDMSFPSGHACAAMTVYGLLAYLILSRWTTGRWRWVVVGLLGLLILAVGLTRMLLGVHYFSDVVGGFLLGLAWVMLSAAVLSRLPGLSQECPTGCAENASRGA